MNTDVRTLVYPLSMNRRALENYLTRRLRPGGHDPRGYLLVQAIQALGRAETIARSMFSPSVEGL